MNGNTIITGHWDTQTGIFQREYPCRCGKIHHGQYAQEDLNHHECFHGPFWEMDKLPGDDPRQIICSQCGEVFEIEKKEKI